MYQSFFFVTNDVEFQEATLKGAKVLGTFMELEKPSANGRVYRFVEGTKIAKSLIGKTIRYGANWAGKHILGNPVIGKVLRAWQEGNKIKGIVNFTDKNIIGLLKKGAKFLFSVGGVAQFGETVQKGKQVFTRLYNAVCTHLQLLPNIPSGAGFPNAKMHKVIEINESVMLANPIEDETSTRILHEIKLDFEESLAHMTESQVLNMAIAKDIASVVEDVMYEPWKYTKLGKK